MIPFIAASDIKLGEALGNMVVGLGVVFLALLFLCGIISLFKLISKLDKSSAKAAPAKAPVKAAPAAAAPAKPALTVRASGKCWLRIRANRKTILETVVAEGWEQTFDLDTPLDVVFGFGQNVLVSTNGTDFASPGKGRQRYEYQSDGTATRLKK